MSVDERKWGKESAEYIKGDMGVNTKDNRRAQETRAKIEAAFFELLEHRHISKVTVREVCENAHVTRTAFYSHYDDLYDLLSKAENKHMMMVISMLVNEKTGKIKLTRQGFSDILRFISEHKSFYRYYLQNTDSVVPRTMKNLSNDENLSPDKKYRIIFFMGGFNATIRQWLETDCSETPEELIDMLEKRYKIPNFSMTLTG